MTQDVEPGDHDQEEEHLHFLHDEGLELLSAYKRIHDKQKRALVRALVNMLAADGAD